MSHKRFIAILGSGSRDEDGGWERPVSLGQCQCARQVNTGGPLVCIPDFFFTIGIRFLRLLRTAKSRRFLHSLPFQRQFSAALFPSSLYCPAILTHFAIVGAGHCAKIEVELRTGQSKA